MITFLGFDFELPQLQVQKLLDTVGGNFQLAEQNLTAGFNGWCFSVDGRHWADLSFCTAEAKRELPADAEYISCEITLECGWYDDLCKYNSWSETTELRFTRGEFLSLKLE